MSSPAGMASIGRLLTGKRRPEHVPEVTGFMLDQFAADPRRRLAAGHSKAINPLATNSHVASGLAANDDFIYRALKHPDTVYYFAGPEVCNLIDATDHPAAVDLTLLAGIGNHTAAVVYMRNIETGNPGDAMAALVITLVSPDSDRVTDNVTRIAASIVHEDISISTFVYPYTLIGPNLAEVQWDNGINLRDGDLTGEQRLVANTLGLLAARSLFTREAWSHYPKAVKTAAKRDRRRLPPINVVSLTKAVQVGLTQHREASTVEREGWWPVRGHFRLQAFGPGRRQHRLTYIAPYAKGNLEGPLIGRPQVHRTS